MNTLKRTIGFLILFSILTGLCYVHASTSNIYEALGLALVCIAFLVLLLIGMLLLLGEL